MANFTSGGGIQCLTGDVAVLNSTIYNNSAVFGGGISNISCVLTLRNTIVANSPSGGNCNGTITSLGHNLDSGNTCAFTGAGDLININPLLGPLTLNAPGTTQTHSLLIGSPAIDAADPTTFPATDQRGVTRPQGVGPDIGAYELVPSVATAVSIPTMTEWGLIIFMVFAGIGSIYFLRIKRRL